MYSNIFFKECQQFYEQPILFKMTRASIKICNMKIEIKMRKKNKIDKLRGKKLKKYFEVS